MAHRPRRPTLRAAQSSPAPRRKPSLSKPPADPTRTARLLRRLCPGAAPRLAIVLGSGFHGVLQGFPSTSSIPYSRLPGFPLPSVPGHDGQLVTGQWHNVPVLLLAGRSHYYEGRSMDEITFPIRVLAALGIQDLILTNAAGGISRRQRPGSFMLLRDHINFMGASPLRGSRFQFHHPFVDLTEVYDAGLRQLLRRAARHAHLPLNEGVYLAVSGPQFETPAEIRAFAKLGADAVGMSTVPEAIVARQLGLRVAGLSCITNTAAGTQPGPLSHQEVLKAGRRASPRAARLLAALARLYGRSC